MDYDHSLIIPEIDFDDDPPTIIDPAPILMDEQEIDEIFTREVIRMDKGKGRKRRVPQGESSDSTQRRRIHHQQQQQELMIPFSPIPQNFQPMLINDEQIDEIFLETSSSRQMASSSSSSLRDSSSSAPIQKFKDIDIYKCKFCNEQFNTIRYLRNHFESKKHRIPPNDILGY